MMRTYSPVTANLNRLFNARPQSYVEEDCVMTFDFFSWRIPALLAHVVPNLPRHGRRVLLIGCGEGLNAAWSLRNIVVGHSSSLVCVDVSDHMSQEGKFFEHNVSACGDTRKVRKLTGNLADTGVLIANQESSFDYIFADFSDLRLELDEQVEFILQLLKPGGLLEVDRQHLHTTPLSAWLCKEGPSNAVISKIMTANRVSMQALHASHHYIFQRVR